MDPREFVHLASQLAVAVPITPARARTSIGRSYYGALNCAVQALDSMRVPAGNGPQAHANAYRLFQQSGDIELSAAGGLLDDLHTLRNRADYNLAPSPTVEDRANAMTAALGAQNIINAIDTVLNDPARRASATAMIRANYQAVTGVSPPP